MLDDIGGLLDEAIIAHEAKDLNLAAIKYTKILEKDARHPDANHNFAILTIELGREDNALPYLQTAIITNPYVPQYWVTFINTLNNIGRIDQAQSVLDQANAFGYEDEIFKQLQHNLDLKRHEFKPVVGIDPIDDLKPLQINFNAKISNNPNPPEIRTQDLINLYNQGYLEKALLKASQMILEFPESAILYNIIATANKGLNKLENAITAYEKAISLQPDYAEAYNNMGIALQEQAKQKEAIKAFKKALSIQPNFTAAYSNMGLALQDLDMQQEALEAYNTALRLNADYAPAYNNCGNVLQAQGKLIEAIEHYKKALGLQPDYIEAYNNLGCAFTGLGKLEKAIQSYKKAISINPSYAEAYTNLGNTLREQGKKNEALTAFKKALSSKPNYAEAYNNMGNVLQEQGNLDKALEAYKKAISLKPDYILAYNNLGATLYHTGNTDRAIEAYNKAISITPDDFTVWNNLYFSLQIIKNRIVSNEGLRAFFPKLSNPRHSNTAERILQYKLYKGQKEEVRYLETALQNISGTKNIIIQNPKYSKSPNEQTHFLPDEIFALIHFGRSGTGLLHSLIDEHPEISTLPSVYFSEYFDHSTWEKIISSGWDGMVNHFSLIYEVLFNATSSIPIKTKDKNLKYNLGISEGLANVGNQKNEISTVDKEKFCLELRRLVNHHDNMDAMLFFKLVHVAYDSTVGENNAKNKIFYHIHNPDTYAQLNFVRLAPKANWIMMVREPIQSCESWIQKSFEDTDHSTIVNKILTMLFEIDNAVYSTQRSIGIRLEDLKEKPQKTIQALCKWMSIKQNKSLYNMTVQGKKWWGDPTSPDYSKDGMDPFGKTSINRKVGSIFTKNDRLILSTLFYPFSVQFGYVPENFEFFQINLNKVRPLLDKPFDFEKSLYNRKKIKKEQFMQSGSYLYFRSGLIERWNTLNEFHNYPNIIKPLKV